MAEGNINFSEGSGKRIHTWDRTISSTLVQDQFMLPGEFPYASYVATANGISTATSGDDLMQVMAGSSLNVRVRRIVLRQQAAASAVASTVIQIVRLTTAGTGGTSVTPRQLDSADAASGATSMTLPSAQGTAGNILWNRAIWLGTAAIPVVDVWEWRHLPDSKPIIIPAGTSNGIALNLVTGVASASLTIDVEFVETAFL